MNPTEIQVKILNKVEDLIHDDKESQTLCNIEWFMRDWSDENLGLEKPIVK